MARKKIPVIYVWKDKGGSHFNVRTSYGDLEPRTWNEIPHLLFSALRKEKEIRVKYDRPKGYRET